MYAQLVEGGTTSDRRAEMDRIVTDELIPALEAEPGYAGAMNLVNASSGEGVMIVLWLGRAARSPSGPSTPRCSRSRCIRSA
jgi:hypothetical protein